MCVCVWVNVGVCVGVPLQRGLRCVGERSRGKGETEVHDHTTLTYQRKDKTEQVGELLSWRAGDSYIVPGSRGLAKYLPNLLKERKDSTVTWLCTPCHSFHRCCSIV